MEIKKRRFTVEMPVPLFEKVVAFQKENYIPTLTAAIIQIIAKYLDQQKEV